MAEAPHAVAVDVGHRAHRAQGEITGRVADAEGRTGAQRLDRERAERAGGDGEQRASLARGGPLQRGADARREAGDGQRRGERPGGGAERARRRRARGVDGVAQDRLDRRREHHLAAVLADGLGDRADVPRRALRVRAVDGGAREARADARRVDRRTGDLDQDPRAAAGRSAVDDVEHLHGEGADVRAAHDGVARALHPRADLGQRHDRIARAGRRGSEKKGQGRGGSDEFAHSARAYRDRGLKGDGTRGQGLEPRLPGPKPGVLPITPPPKGARRPPILRSLPDAGTHSGHPRGGRGHPDALRPAQGPAPDLRTADAAVAGPSRPGGRRRARDRRRQPEPAARGVPARGRRGRRAARAQRHRRRRRGRRAA